MRDSGRPTILCVDDEKSIRHALRRVFLDEPWELLFAASGQEGIEVFRDHHVDLVLSDFRMPGIDGVEFLKRAKEINPDCMRIVLSGYADINLIVEALNEGEIYRFVGKPWNDEELLHNVRGALEHHRLRSQNRRLNAEMRELNAELELKVEARTWELEEKNRVLRFAQVILELLPMPVMGVNVDGMVAFANAKAREFFEDGDQPLVGGPAPDFFEPELTGAIQRVRRRERTGAAPDPAHNVLPMVIDGDPIGAIILTPENDPLDLELIDPRNAFRWSVKPVV
jgi:two-component system NtrC family sensor kinase